MGMWVWGVGVGVGVWGVGCWGGVGGGGGGGVICYVDLTGGVPPTRVNFLAQIPWPRVYFGADFRSQWSIFFTRSLRSQGHIFSRLWSNWTIFQTK